ARAKHACFRAKSHRLAVNHMGHNLASFFSLELVVIPGFERSGSAYSAAMRIDDYCFANLGVISVRFQAGYQKGNVNLHSGAATGGIREICAVHEESFS